MLEAVIGGGDVPREGQHQAQSVLRHRGRAVPRRVRDRHAVLGGRRDVNAVGIPDAEEADEFELGAGGDDLRVHDRVVEEDRIRVTEPLDEVGLVLGWGVVVVDRPELLHKQQVFGFLHTAAPLGKDDTHCAPPLIMWEWETTTSSQAGAPEAPL